MYIELDVSPNELALLGESERLAVEHLGQALFHGYDYVVANRDLAAALGGLPWLSEASAAAFRRLAATASTVRASRRPGNGLVVRRGILEPIATGVGWEVPLTAFSDRRISGERGLICEDLDDVAYYLFIAEVYAHVEGFAGYAISLRPINGGGSNTAMVVRNCVARNDPFLVVVDSDRRESGEPLGDVARRAMEELGPSVWYRAGEATPARAVENLIPAEWLKLTDCGAAASDTTTLLRRAEELGCNELRFYGGLKVDFLICAEAGNARSTAVIRDIERIRRAGDALPAACVGNCTNACKVWTGLGTSVPGQVVRYSSRIRRNGLLRELILVPGAQTLARRVFEFGVAAKRMRV